MKEFMDIACEEALKGIMSGDGGPFGAIVVKNGEIIASGHNVVLATHDSTAHAEITAIRRAEQILETHDLSGCVLYTTCYPCPMCLGAIMWARIEKVYYGCLPEEAAAIGFDDKAFYEAISSPDLNNIVVMEHHINKKCTEVFKTWLANEDRKLY